MSRYLLAGLGNPGHKYRGTRHNVGFMALDRLAERYRLELREEKFKGSFTTGRIVDCKVAMLMPETYMNRSGESVVEAASYYDIPAERIVVAHDDIDLEPGRLKVKSGGGHGGHNGLRDIADKLGSKDFARVRIGVGRPEHGSVTDHVLGRFTRDEEPIIARVLDAAADAIEMILDEGVDAAKNRFNGRDLS